MFAYLLQSSVEVVAAPSWWCWRITSRWVGFESLKAPAVPLLSTLTLCPQNHTSPEVSPFLLVLPPGALSSPFLSPILSDQLHSNPSLSCPLPPQYVILSTNCT